MNKVSSDHQEMAEPVSSLIDATALNFQSYSRIMQIDLPLCKSVVPVKFNRNIITKMEDMRI